MRPVWSLLAAVLVTGLGGPGCAQNPEYGFDAAGSYASEDALVESPAPSPAAKAKPGKAAADAPAEAGDETGEPDSADPDPDQPSAPVPRDEPDDPRLTGIVAAHNAVRSAVSPAPAMPLGALTWSSDAAAVAASWAAGCSFGHNPNRGSLGENIYAASAGYGSTANGVVDSWASEAASYDYASNSCSGVCGHYTQLVWADTTAVGCAVQQCSTGSPFGVGDWELWVCDYAPPGNYVGQRPY